MAQALCSLLLGRDEELASLTSAVDDVAGGRGRALFFLGEAGIGKSRLVRELLDLAAERDFRVLIGRAVESAAPVAFRPLTEALVRGLRTSGPLSLEALGPYRPAAAQLVPEWGLSTDSSAGGLLGVAEALVRTLRLMAGSSRCLLVLEDLHWADPDTLAVVEYLCDCVSAEPSLVVGTMRTEEESAPLSLVRSLQARRSAELLSLPRLDEDALNRMIGACLEADSAPQELVELVDERAEGVPFLVEELLASLLGAGTLVNERGSWCLTKDAREHVPDSFVNEVRRRLQTLDESAQTVLQAAAVFVREFDWELLAPTAGLTNEVVIPALRQATKIQLLTQSETDSAPFWTFRFRHALTRDAVLANVIGPDLAAIAGRAAQILRRVDPQLEGDRRELAAELCERAGDYRESARLLLDLGRRAIDQGALRTAEEILRRASRLAEGDDELKWDVQRSLIDALALAGKVEGVLLIGESLVASAMSDSQRAEAQLRLSIAAAVAGRWVEAEERLTAARSLCGDETEASFLARVDVVNAQVSLGTGRVEEASAYARKALAAAEQSNLPEVACEALEVLGRTNRLSSLAEARPWFERALQLSRTHGLSLWELRALHELGTIDLLDGALLDNLDRALEVAEDSGALGLAATLNLQLSAGYHMRWDPEHTIEAARRCIETASRLRLIELVSRGLVMEASGYAYLGRRADMERLLEEALAVSDHDDDVAAGAWLDSRALIWLLAEDRKRALNAYETGMTYVRRLPVVVLGPGMAIWALLCAVEGTDGGADIDEVRRTGVTVNRAHAGLLRCAEAVFLGRTRSAKRAADAFAEGMDILATLPGYANIARRLVAEAAITDSWGDPAEWLSIAEPFFREHDWPRVASSCRSLMRKAGVVVPRRGRGTAEVPERLHAVGVTTREMDVLQLLVEGLANKEIATRLFLSPRTVERHVASVMTKTGLHARTQLVALAGADWVMSSPSGEAGPSLSG